MGSRGLRALQGLATVATMLAVGTAGAGTIATFSDPASDGGTGLFTIIGNTLSGEWNGQGLNLIAPIDSFHVYPDATFTMSDLTFLDSFGGVLTPGFIQFYDGSHSPILRIDFDSARIFEPFGFGATVFAAQGGTVTFNGTLLPHPITDAETFVFSFANQTPVPGGYSYTAAFTSSGVPEPASLLLLLVGAVAFSRRR